MNERMLELARQAGLKKDHASDREYIGDFDWRLFGDLIVQECILTIQMGVTRDGTKTEKFIRSVKHINDIKEHFGVEE